MNAPRFNVWVNIFTAAALFSFLYTPAAEAQPAPRTNVLLITVDCLRPDHMGLYGYARPTTPEIDRFFKDAFRFKAYAQASWTSPGIVSLLTGLYPSVHGMDLKGKQTSPRASTPLKRLQQAGYATWTYTGDDNYGNLGWDATVPRGHLIETLQGLKDRPFFLWYHFREPHLPYTPPEPFRSEWAGSSSALSESARQAVTRGEMLPKGSATFSAGDAPGIRDLYDAEVRYQDAQLKTLFDFLESSGLADRTVVILTADHAEELMEHGWVGHASTSLHATVFEEVIRIPLLIRIPGRAAPPAPAPVTAQQVDLMPTLFDLLALDAPGAFQGISLVPWIQDAAGAPPRPVLVETSPCGWQCPSSRFRERLYALRSGPWKLVETRGGDPTVHALYNLKEDPGETVNVAASEPRVLARMQAQLAGWQAENLQQAYRRAAALAAVHLEAAGRAIERAQWDAAAAELDAVHRLDAVYRNENPNFMEEGKSDLASGWQKVLDQVRHWSRRLPHQDVRQAGDK